MDGVGDMVGRLVGASEEVRREALRLAALVGRRNSPWVGAYREAFVRAAVAEHLPEGLAAGSGFVVSPEGARSRQLDVVVYETRPDPPAFAEGGIVVAEAARVKGIIEVKSRLARGSFLAALGELTRVKGWACAEEGGGAPVFAALVAFASPSPAALMSAAQEHYSGRLEACRGPLGYKWRVVDLVAVVGGWSLVAGRLPWPSAEEGGGDADIPALASVLTARDGADSSLHLLIAGLLDHLAGFAPRRSGEPPAPLARTWRPLEHPFGSPAVAALRELEGVEPEFLERHDEVFRHKGLRLDPARRLILRV